MVGAIKAALYRLAKFWDREFGPKRCFLCQCPEYMCNSWWDLDREACCPACEKQRRKEEEDRANA